MAIYYRKVEDGIIISGKTYPYRDSIKSIGGRFVGGDKVWHLPLTDDVLSTVHELCRSVGGGPLAEPEARAVRLDPPTMGLRMPASIVDQALFAKEAARVLSESPAASEPLRAEPSETALATSDAGMTIGELMTRIQLAITSAFPRTVWILGELQNCGLRRQGYFFQIAEPKDGASQSATVTAYATLWQGTLKTLTAKHGAEAMAALLQDGLKVRLLCQVSLYRDRGHVTLNVMDVDPAFTKGALALEREKLLKELRAKGLDQANKRRELSPFPLKVGLVTADGSRAKSDFLDQLHAYGFPGQVIFFPAQMQGEALLTEVARGIETLCKLGCDVIVVTRGGGSAADLRWFDSREIAYAIAECPSPVVAAIGHHDDVCVAEEICFQREKTPTAAADFILQVLARTRTRIDDATQGLATHLTRRVDQLIKVQSGLADRLRHAVQNGLTLRTEAATSLASRLESTFATQLIGIDRMLSKFEARLDAGAKAQIEQADRRAERLASGLKTATTEILATKERQVAEVETGLIRIDPRPWLTKGWTQLFGEKGLVRSGDQVERGDKLRARLIDVQIEMTVDEVGAPAKRP